MEVYCHELDKDVLIISADGGIDRQTSGQFVERILKLIEDGMTKIIVDCDKLTYISSWGLGAFVKPQKHAQAPA